MGWGEKSEQVIRKEKHLLLYLSFLGLRILIKICCVYTNFRWKAKVGLEA